MPTDAGSITTGPSFMPAAEMHETPEAIELRVEVGMEAKELNVQVRAEAVSITESARLNSRRGMTRSGGGIVVSDSDSVTGAFSGASGNSDSKDVQTAYLPSLGKFSPAFANVSRWLIR